MTLFSLVFYSTISFNSAYAQTLDSTSKQILEDFSELNLPACEILGTPTLNLTIPKLGSIGDIYDVGNRYKLYDTSVNKQLAFEGTFLTRPAAANLLVNLQNIDDTWKIELNRVLSYNNACWGYRLKLADSEIKLRDSKIAAIEEEMNKRLQIRDEQIVFLNKNLRPLSWYETGEFWFAVGLITGISVTVCAGYALGQASK